MGMYLNTSYPKEAYREMVSDPFFVDKSPMLEELIPALSKKNRYFCITRPRRFGKSVMASMIGAFFSKFGEENELFDHLAIRASESYEKHAAKHNVIYIDFSQMPEDCTSYRNYISRISKGLKEDLIQAYPELELHVEQSIWDNFQIVFAETKERFIFVMDEWDAIFHQSFIKEEEKREYLRFLRGLLKDQVYVELAYMTGVLPIAKYSGGSELNMFLEYDMATTNRFSKYFGFLNTEVDKLYTTYQKLTSHPHIDREDLDIWYDGYRTVSGERIYNPRSIVCALSDNQIRSYWTSSGPYDTCHQVPLDDLRTHQRASSDEVFYYIRNNIEATRDDLVLMVAGEGVEAEIQNYVAVSQELNTKDEIYSAMVVYGLLTYENGKVFIPNRELMEQFKALFMSKDSLGYVYCLARESEQMLKATLAGDTETMVRILEHARDTESPILSYNSEAELSAVVNLVYLAARDRYRVEREEKSGKGFVDFIFYPERRGAEAVILELKVNGTPEAAIEQIKERNYVLRLKGKLGKKAYAGEVLLVGIRYDRRTKEHACKVERVEI